MSNPYIPSQEFLDAAKYVNEYINGLSPTTSSKEYIGFTCSDEVNDIEVLNGAATFIMPFDMTLEDIVFGVSSAPTGANIIVGINQNGTPILSTNVNIDIGSFSNIGSATPFVISNANLTKGSLISIDIVQIGSVNPGVALKGTLSGTIVE